jgi:hypothetical protein
MSVLSRAERQYARAVKNAMLGRNIRAGRQLRSTDALLNMADLLGQKREGGATADAGATDATTNSDKSERRSSRRSRRAIRGPLSNKKRDAAQRAAYDAVMAAQGAAKEREARIAEIDANLAAMDAKEEADAVAAIENLDTELGRDLSISPEVYGGKLADYVAENPGMFDNNGVPNEGMLNYLLNPNVAGAYSSTDGLPYSYFENEVPGRQVALEDDGDFKGYVNRAELEENIAALGDPDDFNRLLGYRPDVKIPEGFADEFMYETDPVTGERKFTGITEESLSRAEAAQRSEAEEAEYRDVVENISNLDTESGESVPEDPVYSDEEAREAQAALNLDEEDPDARRVLLSYRAERGDRDALKELRELVDARPRQYTPLMQPLPPQLIPSGSAELPSFIPNI